MLRDEIQYLSDRMPVTDRRIPPTLLEEMENRGLILPEMKTISFCGIIAFSGGLAVFLPRNSAAVDEMNGLPAHYLLHALLKFYRDKDTAITDGDGEQELIGGESLSLAVSLIEDFQSNGLYVHRSCSRTANVGKTDWPRTIARNTAFLGRGGVVYLDLATTRSRYLKDTDTAKIHAEVMRAIYTLYGVLWTGITGIPRILREIPQPTGSVAVWIAHLRKELQRSYSERDMFLLRSLIRYLENGRSLDSGGVIAGVRKFHALWEAMLDACLPGKYKVNGRLPIPVYRTADNQCIPVAGKGQRTDTVIQNAEKTHVAIIDAKYYDARTPDTAPGWTDLVKQFFYRNAIAHLEPAGVRITNHFVFPGMGRPLETVHVSNRGQETIALADYPAICCHYQEPLALLRRYSEGGKLQDLSDQILAL